MTKEEQLRELGYEPTRELLSIMDNLPGDHGRRKARAYLEKNPDPKLAQLWGVRVAGMTNPTNISKTEEVVSLAQEALAAWEEHLELLKGGDKSGISRVRGAHAAYKAAVSSLIQSRGL